MSIECLGAKLFAERRSGGGIAAKAEQVLEPSYNVAPTQTVYAVVERTPKDEPEKAPVRSLQPVRWGLVPSWAKDPAIGNRMINARMETVAEKPAYKKAFAKRRCLLPADGYFEWYGETKGKKQPFFIHPADGSVLAMAGLYELWRDKSKPDDDPDRWLWTCTVLTTTPSRCSGTSSTSTRWPWQTSTSSASDPRPRASATWPTSSATPPPPC